MSLADAVRIAAPRLEQVADHARVVAEVRLGSDVRSLYFRVPSLHADLLDAEVASDAFALVGMLRAMRDGRPLVVEGPVSSLLAYRLETHAMPIMATIGATAGLRPIPLAFAGTVARKPEGHGAITGFSAGVDSFHTVLSHLPGRVREDDAVRILLHNNIGSHGAREEAGQVFRQRAERMQTAAAELGLPLVELDSNIDDFLDLDFQLTATVRNAAAALLFQRKLTRMLYASSYAYGDIGVRPNYTSSMADPLLLPALSTEAMQLMDHGTNLTRFEKTAAIADNPIVARHLDVCVKPNLASRFVNCGRCFKCVRTLTTLEILGVIDRFAGLFDLVAWRRSRDDQIYTGLRSDNPYWQEIVAEMRARKWDPGGLALQLSPFLPRRFYRPLAPILKRIFPHA